MVSTPFFTEALAWSGLTLQGSWRLRANFTWLRSCRCAEYPSGATTLRSPEIESPRSLSVTYTSFSESPGTSAFTTRFRGRGFCGMRSALGVPRGTGTKWARLRRRRSWPTLATGSGSAPDVVAGAEGSCDTRAVNIQEHVALLDARLDRLSVGRRCIASLGFDPQAVEFAIYRPGAGYTPERPALPFQFEIAPWSKDDEAGGAAPNMLLRGRAVVSNVHNVLLPMPSTSFGGSRGRAASSCPRPGSY